MANIFDLAVIGAGVSGMYAAYKIAKEHKNIRTIIFELGRPPQKRRAQTVGYGGCLPTGDGKIYLNDINKIADIVGSRSANAAYKQFFNITTKFIDLKTIKDKSPNISAIRRLEKYNFALELNDYIQLFPKDIHILLKNIANKILDAKHITTRFDNEVHNIIKNKNDFTIISDNEEIKCKKLLICAGRGGWRWVKSLYESFDIITNNDYAKFGIRIECSSSVMKDFHKSNCSMSNDILDIGPLSWAGTVIPEDHIDMAISAFRSNEARWKSDKVSFNMMSNIFFKNNGFEQTNRIGQLTFILGNDRVIKEKLSSIINNKSQISIIPEYDWLSDAITNINNIMPDIIQKGYFHVPTILPLVPKINVKKDMSTDVKNMFVAGESSGATGILTAALSGIIAADSICK
jgi:uncharacterized FAD-dependent dehydrogenase